MKTPTKIFILVLLMLAFLASLAWVGVRHIADILREFDHVAQVDLILMEGATNLNNIQLKKEIVFEKLSASSEELAFGQVNAARGEYLKEYVRELGEQFDRYIKQADQEMQRIGKLAVPEDLKISFEDMREQTQK